MGALKGGQPVHSFVQVWQLEHLGGSDAAAGSRQI